MSREAKYKRDVLSALLGGDKKKAMQIIKDNGPIAFAVINRKSDTVRYDGAIYTCQQWEELRPKLDKKHTVITLNVI